MINYKNIIEDTKNKCLICSSEKHNSGITILDNFICEDCISKINTLSINDKEYEKIKNKLKGMLINYL